MNQLSQRSIQILKYLGDATNNPASRTFQAVRINLGLSQHDLQRILGDLTRQGFIRQEQDWCDLTETGWEYIEERASDHERQHADDQADVIHWHRTGNLYWAGHDLMQTIHHLLHDESGARVVFGLRQSLHHVRALGLGGNPAEIKLAELKERAERILEMDWTQEQRAAYARELALIRDDIGRLAISNQAEPV